MKTPGSAVCLSVCYFSPKVKRWIGLSVITVIDYGCELGSIRDRSDLLPLKCKLISLSQYLADVVADIDSTMLTTSNFIKNETRAKI